MIRKETGFKIIKYKGKAVSVAMCAMFCVGGSSGAFAGDTAVSGTVTAVAITVGNTPVFDANGTATVANGVNPDGDARTTGGNATGNITFDGSSAMAGSLGANGAALNTITLTNTGGSKTVGITGQNQYVTAIVLGGATSTLTQTAATGASVFSVTGNVSGTGIYNIVASNAATHITDGRAVTASVGGTTTLTTLTVTGGNGGVSGSANNAGLAGGAITSATFSGAVVAPTITLSGGNGANGMLAGGTATGGAGGDNATSFGAAVTGNISLNGGSGGNGGAANGLVVLVELQP